MKSLTIKIISIGILFSFMVLMFNSCEEHDVPFASDEEVITRIIYETEQGQELFRTNNIFLDEPYTIPFDNSIYKVRVDSVIRDIDYTINMCSWDSFNVKICHEFENHVGLRRDAEVIIDDFFYLTYSKINGADTVDFSRVRLLTRIGFFLKLGNDGDAYLGWKLWGFNGGIPASGQFNILAENGEFFHSDFRDLDNFRFIEYRSSVRYDNNGASYIAEDTTVRETKFRYQRLDAVGVPDVGDKLYLTTNSVDNSSYYQIISAKTNNGYEMSMSTRSDSSQYVDTLQIPTGNSKIWNFLFIQDIDRYYIQGGQPPDTMGTNWFGWCVPYRIDL
jgi:hypothetical protein